MKGVILGHPTTTSSPTVPYAYDPWATLSIVDPEQTNAEGVIYIKATQNDITLSQRLNRKGRRAAISRNKTK